MLTPVPFVLIIVITTVDLTTPIRVHYGAALILAPLLMAMIEGPWLTAVTALLAVCAQIVIAVHFDVLEVRREEAVQIIVLTVLSTMVVWFARVYQRRRRQFEQLRSVSETAQKAVMRPLPSRLGGLQIASFYLAAAAEARIGGDLFTATRTGYGARVLIGDVRGKGLNAVGESALLVGAFREAAASHRTLPELAAALDRSVGRFLADYAEDYAHPSEHFTTAVLLNIPEHESVVEVVSCGHPPPLLVHDGTVRVLESSDPAPPLGMHVLELGDECTDVFEFTAGDTLLLYTDGVVEARDELGAFYPLAERLRAWAREKPDDLLQSLREDLSAFCGGRLDDDVAVIAIHRVPSPLPRPAQDRRTGGRTAGADTAPGDTVPGRTVPGRTAPGHTVP
ncbi:Serine phosphatase RsbU, regulator of sigma subunit [Streptacidiphilus jiangxiensis]|uniref:Serine phosphatase RsbU, regulator of sigma subunit n=1 Tax=Streptacidiphilus jiangxiensis TaxID=235985 RepID=A0A1H8A218_STRJI|nr:Serine phosphatase RsbU, regulator of sigma subunit [Streptacidiphilus jiangxiensis]